MFALVHDAARPQHPLTMQRDLPVPSLRTGEVVIETAYAGVNRADLMQRTGNYPPPVGHSPLLGLEVSGTVAAVGAQVSGWRVGDAVCALCDGGGYAQYVAVSAGQVLAVPTGWRMDEAAALPEALFTCWLNLCDIGALQPGEHLLIHGGASGVGSLAIQLAGLLGASVTVTVGSPEKAAFCEALGAATIQYRQEDFAARLTADGEPSVDVVLDYVGADYFDRNLRVLKPYGRLLSLGFLSGARGAISAAPLLLKQLRWSGATLRSRSSAQKAALADAIRERTTRWLAERRLVPPLDRVYPLEQAEQALSRMGQNANLGKIVLKVAA